MSEQVGSAFAVLNAINVNEHAEKKNGLTYLSWAWAWAEVKKAFPMHSTKSMNARRMDAFTGPMGAPAG